MQTLTKNRLLSIFLLILLLAVLTKAGLSTDAPLSDIDGHTPELSTEYLVTQYADASGAQGTFYTVENEDYFMIIDGGWADNADAVRKIIQAHGSHVDAWIISHPHRDHAGAFNEIMKNPDNITIDAIYDNGFDYDFIEETGEPYDDITVMETYYSLTKDDARVTHLKRGDSIEICGLTLDVLNAWDEYVLYTVGDEKDYQNNASLLFLLKSKNTSMLFCSDIKYDMDMLLKESLRGSLSCDYVQTGHHGNWSFSEEFYDSTGARAYFFDAPSEITDSPDFPASALKRHFLDHQKSVFDFSTAPNAVIFK
ncbi:MAG: MBL fold metallo-hydrolase [Roseburia sp.]|nr:MBL fold metallo-hydrolase [Roseburia sp.]